MVTRICGVVNINQTSVSQELHFYRKAVHVLDLYHSHLNLYTKSAFVSRNLATIAIDKYVIWLCSTCS